MTRKAERTGSNQAAPKSSLPCNHFVVLSQEQALAILRKCQTLDRLQERINEQLTGLELYREAADIALAKLQAQIDWGRE